MRDDTYVHVLWIPAIHAGMTCLFEVCFINRLEAHLQAGARTRPACKLALFHYTNWRRAHSGTRIREDLWAMSNIEERVKKIVVEQLGVKEDEVTNEASFVEDLGADSLDTVELVMALEEEFKTEIPDEDAEKITTVQEAIDYVSEHVKKEKD